MKAGAFPNLPTVARWSPRKWDVADRIGKCSGSASLRRISGGNAMINRTPLAVLIETRMQQLALDRPALGLRLGYRNPAKAAGRVSALCDGQITSAKSKTALHRLPEAIEVPVEVVETAVNATLSILAELKRQADERL